MPEQKEQRFYCLTLSEEDLRVIAAALNDLPYRLVAPVMDKLKAETERQDGFRRPTSEVSDG